MKLYCFKLLSSLVWILCLCLSYHSITISQNLLLPVKLLKGRDIPLSAFPKDTTSELARFSPHYPFNAKRQARKL